MDMSKYKGMFISETKEHLQTMNKLIISLEKNPDSKEDIDALFREAHSVKGMAASMDYRDIADLSHKMEDMMDRFRKGESTPNPDSVDLLFEGLDALEQMVRAVEEEIPLESDYSSIISRMVSINGKVAEAGKAPQSAAGNSAEAEAVEETGEVGSYSLEPSPGRELFEVDVQIEKSAQLPGMRAFLVFKKLDELGDIISVEPDIESVKDGDFDNRLVLNLSTEHDAAEVEKILKSMADIAVFTVEKISVPEAGDVEGAWKLQPSREKRAALTGGKARQVRTVRVTTDLLDNLINIVGEMIIARSRLYEVSRDIASVSLKEAEGLMSNLIRDLHNQVMVVRMTPMADLMDRLPRVVRDMARKSGKKVELQIEGKDIEVDRAIVDEMGNPMIHILRNCMDHGIELPEEREKAGKNAAARILIRAMRERDQIILNIDDDGRGMDVKKIKRKAVEKGLIKEDQVKSMSDKEACMLVCHPGLSTAEKVTDVSGRGVGMDAVKSVVDSIGGSLYINSASGKGTSITIKLPLTVAIVQVLLVKVGGETFAIPINKIVRTLDVSKEDLKRSQRQLAVFSGDELIPLLSLKKILRIEKQEGPASSIAVVVAEMRGKKVGLVVDALIGQQEVFIKPLEPPLGWVKGFSGATILGDGSVVFVVDISNLL